METLSAHCAIISVNFVTQSYFKRTVHSLFSSEIKIRIKSLVINQFYYKGNKTYNYIKTYEKVDVQQKDHNLFIRY